MMTPLFDVTLVNDQDVVIARQRARQLAGLLGFDQHDQVRIATAVSELSREGVNHGGETRVEFALDLSEDRMFLMRVHMKVPATEPQCGRGSGHEDRAGDLQRSEGVIAARRMLPLLETHTEGRATCLVFGRKLPAGCEVLDPSRARELSEELNRAHPKELHQEYQAQNQELSRRCRS